MSILEWLSGNNSKGARLRSGKLIRQPLLSAVEKCWEWRNGEAGAVLKVHMVAEFVEISDRLDVNGECGDNILANPQIAVWETG